MQNASDARRIVIVGASVAGLTTVETLRAGGFTGSVTLIGEEDHMPYGRPPLSKQVLTGDWSPDRAELSGAAELAALDVRILRGRRATGLDLRHRSVFVGGDAVPYDLLVIATGVIARRMEGTNGLAGVHCLRTVDDAMTLRSELASATRVVVVGAGVLGSEIAAAVRKSGIEVSLVGRTAELRLGQLGGHLSCRLADLHRANGVDLRLGVGVRAVLGAGRASAVRLSDGSVISTEVIVAAIGSLPATKWLEDSGLKLADGILCDADGLAAPDVYAVGDVARWRDDETGAFTRAEHYLGAIEEARSVARLIVTGQKSAAVVPFFWSELYGTRIQAYGRFPADTPLTAIAGDPNDARFVAESVIDDRTVGVVGWNMPREFRVARAGMSAAVAVRTGLRASSRNSSTALRQSSKPSGEADDSGRTVCAESPSVSPPRAMRAGYPDVALRD